jgi:endonuclease G
MKHNILKGFILGMVFGIIIFCASGSHSIANDPHRPEIHCKHFIYGIPLGTSITNDIIIRDIYAMSSNDSTKFADWVAYRLDVETVVGKAKTKRVWKADPWLADDETLEPEDYKGAYKTLNTDRGHQAPLASFKGTKYWAETNYLSNITPQKSALNRGPWRILEGKVRAFVKANRVGYVLTGPLYEKEMPKLPGADEEHRIPSGYWKIFIYNKESKNISSFMTASFIFPQDTPRKANILDYLVTIDEVEKRSCLDILWELPDNIEDKVESARNLTWARKHFQ